jgi:hypothetical protein
MMPRVPWIVCQLGAREHSTVPRALHRRGVLEGLVTDLWASPKHFLADIPLLDRLGGMRSLRDRYHPELAGARVLAPNFRTLVDEVFIISRGMGAHAACLRAMPFSKPL